MKTDVLTAAPEDAGARLDRFLSEKLDDLTRNAAAHLILSGHVSVNGRTGKKNDRLSGGETVLINRPAPAEAIAQPQDIPLKIVYEDDDMIVIDKPKGMVVHPAPGNPEGTLVNALLHHLDGSLSGIGGTLRPGIVHRIDKDTSGLLVAAKNDTAHRHLAAQIKAHTARRAYEAVVYGRLRAPAGTITLPVGRHRTDRKKMTAGGPSGKEAVTHYQVLAEYNGFSHIRLELETGRTHQIRVHMAAVGHPVAGDGVYGSKKDKTGLFGQCLHAVRLELTHPKTGERMVFSSPLPEYFTAFLRKLGADPRSV